MNRETTSGRQVQKSGMAVSGSAHRSTCSWILPTVAKVFSITVLKYDSSHLLVWGMAGWIRATFILAGATGGAKRRAPNATQAPQNATGTVSHFRSSRPVLWECKSAAVAAMHRPVPYTPRIDAPWSSGRFDPKS